MQIEIPLRSAVTVTIDPERHVLCITDRELDVPLPGQGQSNHVWLNGEQHSTGRNRFNQIPQEHAGYTFEELVDRLFKRKAVWVVTIAGAGLLGFIVARHPDAAHQRARLEALERSHAPPAANMPVIPSQPTPSSTPLPASPNAAFGLD